ncbi:MAG: ATP-binding protein [Armatimonadetes bacterium]|nr:ATP-binding protein [Armatimonadota bacterium]PIU64306.1 MAG: AAA family ATPase [Armatimonadetes bacterium CG07_land_8_20_14_0_80_59_28]PIX40807.1 MAG: AAA family ATPase [Armatimonadetes bacterium CG_4_8_14_3_um_filter_58_9]PIY44778.1 MAG: AAA family ATPase [Armatimonadetes bacterium CG_4_10_14_3_um_filter_59_10]
MSLNTGLDFEKVRGLLQERDAREETGAQIPAPVLPDFPSMPNSVEETGLSFSFLCDLAMKTLLAQGQITGGYIADFLRVPYQNVLENVLRFLRDDGQVEIKKGAGYDETTWELALTNKGMVTANSIMDREGYIGPAPVPLATYNRQIEEHPAIWESVTEELLRSSVDDLVVSSRTLAALGPAFNSGHSMFLYGNAGNGKTLLSERLSQSLRGGFLLPFAVEAGGQVIRIFDAVYHEVIQDPQEVRRIKTEEGEKAPRVDERWIVASRPFIITGGELTLDKLELNFDPKLRYYIAPLQMKANGGILMIDDFGRQQMSPRDLLNRWIVPLEKRYDFHNLVSGLQIQVPFEVFIIFSTNLAPKDLVEEAFLRRIRYKIEIGDPPEEDFREIFRRCCSNMNIPFQPEMLEYLVEEHYHKVQRGFRSVHPRDLLSQIKDISGYRGEPPTLTKDLIDTAVATYFVDLG